MIIQIPVPSAYFISFFSFLMRQTLGLCGTLNGSPADDFKFTGSNLETVASKFGRMCSISSTTCEDMVPASDSCTTYSQFSSLAVSICDELKNYPFSGCDDVDVDVYIKKCKEDVCACKGMGSNEECECDSFSRYARACSRYDTVFETWRTELNKCTSGEYHSLAPPCLSAGDMVKRARVGDQRSIQGAQIICS